MELTEPLNSWTRTLEREAALTLLEAAEPGMTLDEWSAVGDQILPQPSEEQRRKLINFVKRDLLDHKDEEIRASAFLRLFQDGTPHRRQGLLAAKLSMGKHRSLITYTLINLIHPTLREAEEPLAHPDAGRLEPEDWDRFLRSCLKSTHSEEVVRKTRTSLQRVLAEVGCLEIHGNQSRTTLVRRGRPEGAAFSWLVSHQLWEEGRREAFDSWAVRESFAAQLFATTVPYALTCLEVGVHAGLFTRSHLAGKSRIQLGENR